MTQNLIEAKFSLFGKKGTCHSYISDEILKDMTKETYQMLTEINLDVLTKSIEKEYEETFIQDDLNMVLRDCEDVNKLKQVIKDLRNEVVRLRLFI